MLRPSKNFRPYCPKCKSTHIDVVTVRGWGKSDQCMTCHICGTQRYGTENIQQLFLAQQNEWQLEQMEEERLAIALRDKRIAHYRAEQAKKEKERLAPFVVPTPIPIIALQDKCAWADCSSTRSSKSKYCSRACSNKNAHARERERKSQLKRSA